MVKGEKPWHKRRNAARMPQERFPDRVKGFLYLFRKEDEGWLNSIVAPTAGGAE